MKQAELDSLLLDAAKLGLTKVVCLLIEAGADVTAGNNHAVKWAAENGHTEVVDLLVAVGATLDRKAG